MDPEYTHSLTLDLLRKDTLPRKNKDKVFFYDEKRGNIFQRLLFAFHIPALLLDDGNLKRRPRDYVHQVLYG